MTSISSETLTVALQDPRTREVFNEAVRLAMRSSGFGATEGSFDIDSLNVLVGGIESQQYAQTHMGKAQRFANRIELLQFAATQIIVSGPILEFGVFSGETINTLATALPGRQAFGFDSFEGLPESWAGLDKGHFSTKKNLPFVQPNVELVVGWFDETLPKFLRTHEIDQVPLLHIDCDLYSSTKTVFRVLGDRVRSGTIIVFDEYFNYPGWRMHEYLAFQELVKYRSISYEYIGISPQYQHVCVRIL